MLVDRFHRRHTSLRISVTDRCNIRCTYCMAEDVRFLPREEILSFEEIERFVKVAASLGVTKLRLTGGEPLLRAELPNLVSRLTIVPGIQEVALTTNGLLLADLAHSLRQAGLNRLNISLDTLKEETFRQISRRNGLSRVLEGIQAAHEAGFTNLRLNAVIIRGVNDHEVVSLVRFARVQQAEMRFIEFMPLDGEENWTKDHVVSSGEIRQKVEAELGPLSPKIRTDPSQPASDYQTPKEAETIGLISPVSEPFCESCNRLRITAEGKIRNCLFSTTEWDVRQLLRQGSSDQEIAQLIQECVAEKRSAHGIDSPGFQRPERAMYQIGG